MAKSAAALDAFYDAVLKLLPEIMSSKPQVTLQEFESELLLTVAPEMIANASFKRLLALAWELCDKKSGDEVKKELKGCYFDEIKKLNCAIVLPNAVVAYTFLTDTAREEFGKQREKYRSALCKLALKRTAEVISSRGDAVSYDLVRLERRLDAFGPWEVNKLFGLMKIYLLYPSAQDPKALNCLPPLWRTAQETTRIQCEERMPTDPIFNKTHAVRSTLKEFIESELRISDDSQLEGIFEILKARRIVSVDDLMKIRDWTELKSNLPAHYEELDLACQRHKGASTVVVEQENSARTKGEELGYWHMVKRFLLYEAGMMESEEMGVLDKVALNTGFEEQKRDKEFDGGPVLKDIQYFMNDFTIPKRPLRKSTMGLLLHGPPGTGKTELCKVIIKKAGLFGLVPPLASSEVNRSLVGETERVVMAIFHRALYLPHLLCCIAIDEIDALVPIRNEKSGAHKTDVLSLLLALLGGIKNVSNVFLIGSTNRLNKIDEAFARRLEEKFYVGRLSPEQGVDIMRKMAGTDTDSGRTQLPAALKERFLNNVDMLNLFKLLITNFSGAAVSSLRSKLLKYYDRRQGQEASIDLKRVLIELSTKVANNYQIKFGGYCIPSIVSEDSSTFESIRQLLRSKIPDSELNKLTGRVLVDLRDDHLSIQLQRTDPANPILEIDLDNLFTDKNNNSTSSSTLYPGAGSRRAEAEKPRKVKFTADLITFLIVLAIRVETPSFQLIDANMMLANSAFDQSAAFEILMEKLIDFKEYANSMVIFDADTLVGISENMSDSSMSESLSYSIQHSDIWQKVVLHTFMSIRPGRTHVDHKWAVIVSSSEFLINQFKKIAKFELSKKEVDFRERERTCVNCGVTYVEKENRKDACTYHLNKLLTKVFNVNKKDHRIEQSKEALIKSAGDKTDTKEFDEYYYTCCMKRLNESEGCQTSFHVEKKQPEPSKSRYY